MNMTSCFLLLQLSVLYGVIVSSARAATEASATFACGGDFRIAGSDSANHLLRAWASAYSEKCQKNNATVAAPTITIEDTTSSTGAAQVCGVRKDATVVDVSSMTRSMNRLEAKQLDNGEGWRFACERSIRGTVQIEVGIEGAALATAKYGAAVECIEKLGGLSLDQLRWMFSDLTETQLIEEWDGFNATSAVPFSDKDDATRLWSELHSECQPVEIYLLGLATGTPIVRYLERRVFKARGESFDASRYMGLETMEALVTMLQWSPNNVGFFGIRYVLSEQDRTVIEPLTTIKIRPSSSHEGDFVDSGVAALDDGAYALANRIYLNLASEEATLANIRPFVDFGLSEEGTAILLETGFWSLDEWERVVMKTRAQTSSGIPLAHIQSGCGPFGGEIAIAGSSTVFPVAQVWSAIYQIGCDVGITVETGGSSGGAGRVCANREKGSPVDIGGMSRGWKEEEAKESMGFLYDCLKGDTERSTIQVPVALDGVTVATGLRSSAGECIEFLGGLTVDQLRWMFSDYNEAQLEATGWDVASIKNSDGDPSTHLWSELDERCKPLEIAIAGPDETHGTYDFFSEVILTDQSNGETFASNRIVNYEGRSIIPELVLYLQQMDTAISYFGYAFYYANRDNLLSVAVQNEKNVFVAPTETTIGDGSYNPLARAIYMNVRNDDEASLENTVPFVSFGLRTLSLVATTGFVAIAEKNNQMWIERLEAALYGQDDSSSDLSAGEIAGIAAGVAFALVCILFLRHRNK